MTNWIFMIISAVCIMSGHIIPGIGLMMLAVLSEGNDKQRDLLDEIKEAIKKRDND